MIYYEGKVREERKKERREEEKSPAPGGIRTLDHTITSRVFNRCATTAAAAHDQNSHGTAIFESLLNNHKVKEYLFFVTNAAQCCQTDQKGNCLIQSIVGLFESCSWPIMLGKL